MCSVLFARAAVLGLCFFVNVTHFSSYPFAANDGGASETDAPSDMDELASLAPSQSATTVGGGSERMSVAARNAPVEASHAALESRNEVHTYI